MTSENLSPYERLKNVEPFSMQETAEEFFSEVLSGVFGSDARFVVVGHFVSTLLPFVRSLEKVGSVLGIIRKGTPPDPRVFSEFEPSTFSLTREDIRNDPNGVLDSIVQKCEGKQLVLIDIGGYFAPIAALEVAQGLTGIIEDTENGHQKYQTVFQDSFAAPVVSVARSLCKRNEDNWVGRSIVYSTEKLFRTGGSGFSSKRVLVLGFGKIGNSIADSIRSRGNSVMVWDSDATQRVFARNQDFLVLGRKDAIKLADVVFCATGNGALSIPDFELLQSNALVVSVTSQDDELPELSKLDFDKMEMGHVTKYSRAHSSFYVALKGNAVNFIDGAEIRPYIYLVQAAMLEGVRKVLTHGSTEFPHELEELAPEEERRLSELFEKYFFTDSTA